MLYQKQQCTDSIRPYSILTKLIFSVELWNCAIRFALNMEKSKKLHYYCISTYFFAITDVCTIVKYKHSVHSGQHFVLPCIKDKHLYHGEGVSRGRKNTSVHNKILKNNTNIAFLMNMHTRYSTRVQ